jgi:hypothetical protein
MIESLIEGLKDQIGDQILEKTDVQPDQLPGILSVIGDRTRTEVRDSMLEGGLGTVMNLFSNKPNGTSADLLQSSITKGVVSGLIEKIGLKSSTASLIAGIAVPLLMEVITRKNNETPEDDPSPISALFGDDDGRGSLGGNILNNFIKKSKRKWRM